jgi:hypothetical protein
VPTPPARRHAAATPPRRAVRSHAPRRPRPRVVSATPNPSDPPFRPPLRPQASNDGSAFVDVLQRLYPDEWVNFVERLGLAELPKARYTEDAALGMQVRL